MRPLVILLLIIPFVSFAQTEEERITAIRKWFKETESKLKACKQFTYQDLQDPDYVTGGSSDQVVYFDTATNQIIKITEYIYYDWAYTETSWYFNQSKCYFVFEKSSSVKDMYTAEELGMTDEEFWQSGGEAKTMEHTENRLYFNKEGKCIRYLVKNKVVSADESSPDMSEVKNEKDDPTDGYCVELKIHGETVRKMAVKKMGSTN